MKPEEADKMIEIIEPFHKANRPMTADEFYWFKNIVISLVSETDIEVTKRVIKKYYKETGSNLEKWSGDIFVLSTRFYDWLDKEQP